MEGCAYCNGRYALFASYSRFLAPGLPSRYQAADLVESGIRIQGRRRVSPFFDAGFAAGVSRFLWGAGNRTTIMAGAGAGTGVAFRFAEGMYVRPQVRLRVMARGYVAGTLEIAAGYRF
jgi:hypothetical protein